MARFWNLEIVTNKAYHFESNSAQSFLTIKF